MKIIDTQTPLLIQGICIRTQNSAEQDPSTAKIGDLWTDFGKTVGPHMTEQMVYGVYHDYASNDQGAFNVTAGVFQSPELSASAIPNLTEVELQAGRYMVFSNRGEMPQRVIETWQEIWTYFNAEGCPYQRAYVTDFEHYTSQQTVDIYIGIC